MLKKIMSGFVFSLPLFLIFQVKASAEVKEYRLDPAQSEMTFDVRAAVYTVHGKVASVVSKVFFDAEKGEVKLPMQVEIPVDSMTTKNKRRDRDMQKMFDSNQHPVISWTAENVECSAPKADQALVCEAAGVLKIHGVEKKAAFPVSLKIEGNRVLASGSLSLKRDDYGLKTPTMLGIIRVSQNVDIEFHTNWISDS